MADELQLVKIDGVEMTGWYSSFTANNVLTYTKEPSRLSDFSLKNEDIEAAYVPTAKFTFAYLDETQFAWFILRVNTKGFFVEYYDYEIQTWVKRRMYMSQNEIERIYNFKQTYKGVLGLTVTFVSKFGYPYAGVGQPNYNYGSKLTYGNVYYYRTETRT